ncbi:unnamed protein product [Durusdinium trenchii]|uniref:Uncharacterized protein n=1 Tax=Durusdinium trenchii TaxID=1381693 RepID=A0ABP0HG26_9DINO
MWWAEGIRFGCTSCGRCCVRRVPAASAPLAKSEIEGMAQALSLSTSGFLSKYTTKMDKSSAVELKVDSSSGRCLLLSDSGKCSVHNARPAACRTYPFWPENLASPYEWAREAVLCEGIQSTWSSASKEKPPVDQLETTEESLTSVPARSVEDELLVEELRLAGHLSDENWSHSEAMDYIAELREANMSELELEPMPAPRQVLWHEGGLVVLETQGGESDIIRSLHFESSIGVVQTEVRSRPEGFDFRHLAFEVHAAFLRLLEDKAAHCNSVDATVVVLGGGGGVLPMAIQDLALRHHSFGALKCIRRIISVEKDPAVAELGKKFFGFREGGAQVEIELRIEDALNFFDAPQPLDILAIFVDIAGEFHRFSSGEVLAPSKEFLQSSFVTSAAAAVRPNGVVVWNVLFSELGEDALLQSTLNALHAEVQEESFSIVPQGPIRRSSGVAQWLLSSHPR